MNCIVIDDDVFSRKLVEEYVRKTESLVLLHSVSSAIEALNLMNSGDVVDLIFLDIEMPEMSGLDFLNSLTVFPQIIIISQKEKYAVNAFDFELTDYLLKPITYSRFHKAVQKALNRHKDTVGNDIFIKQNNLLLKLKFSDILWIEAMENYVVINCFSEKYTIHFTMLAIEKKLPSKQFVRVHRSFIVNIDQIHSIVDKTIVIATESSPSNHIPIGKVYKNNLLKTLNLMVREGG